MPRKRKPGCARADAPVNENVPHDGGPTAHDGVGAAGGAPVAGLEAGPPDDLTTRPAGRPERPWARAATPPAAALADPYRPLFTCRPKGFEMGEDRRFKQRVFRFKDKPEAAVVERLKAAGYTYRAQEKAWTVAATPQTRLESEEMAQAFAGTEAVERADGVRR